MICTTLPYQKSVLSGILALATKDSAAAVRRCSFLATNVRVEHFTDSCEIIFRSLLVYYRTVGATVSYEHFVDMIRRRGLDEVEFNAATVIFVELRDSPVIVESEFRYQVARLREVAKTDRLTDTLVDTMDLLMSGRRHNGRMITGYDAAVTSLQKRLTELERNDNNGTTFSTRRDVTRVIADYSDRKFKRKVNFATGIDEVDEALSGGLQLGDLAFIAGYTSEGKTSLLYTMIDRWVFGGAKLNVAIGTAESTPEVVQRRMLSIRSADPKYGGIVPYKLLKEGRLGQDGERRLEQVAADMAYNEAFGNYHIFSIPSSSTVETVYELVGMVNVIFPVDIFGWDYCGYTTSETRRSTDREDMGHVIRSAKVKSANFNNGRGVATVSPFQVSRGKYETAVKNGFYTLTCMEETSAAEKAADVVMSVLQIAEQNKTVGQLLKNRDGAKYSTPFELPFDQQTMRYVPRPKGVSL